MSEPRTRREDQGAMMSGFREVQTERRIGVNQKMSRLAGRMDRPQG